MRLLLTLLASTLPLILGACFSVGPNHTRPAVAHSSGFVGAQGQSAPVLDKWWQQLSNRQLNGFINAGLSNNHDLGIAAQRLRESRALRKQAASALLPQAGVNLSFSRDSLGGLFGQSTGIEVPTNPLEYWNAGIDVAWEIDVFGGTQRKVRGARAREEVSREALHGARLALAAEVTDAYFTLAALREQHKVTQTQVELLESETDDIRERVAAGSSAQVDVSRSSTRLETTRSRLPGLESGITTQLRRLSLLLGERPDALDRRNVASISLPEKLPMARAGIPADLIMRRPDLRQAERELAAATEEIGVAVANFYPKFSIGGGPTGFSNSFGNLFNTGNYFWRYTPRVEWSLFSGGANHAILEAANARQKAALLSYEKSVLAAIGEVESELANLRAETQRLAIIQRARAAASDAAKRVRATYEAGATDFVDVLVEEQRLRELEITEVRVRSQMLQVWIRLHKALGGGWK